MGRCPKPRRGIHSPGPPPVGGDLPPTPPRARRGAGRPSLIEAALSRRTYVRLQEQTALILLLFSSKETTGGFSASWLGDRGKGLRAPPSIPPGRFAPLPLEKTPASKAIFPGRPYSSGRPSYKVSRYPITPFPISAASFRRFFTSSPKSNNWPLSLFSRSSLNCSIE